jgi:hypothetical protein
MSLQEGKRSAVVAHYPSFNKKSLKERIKAACTTLHALHNGHEVQSASVARDVHRSGTRFPLVQLDLSLTPCEYELCSNKPSALWSHFHRWR